MSGLYVMLEGTGADSPLSLIDHPHITLAYIPKDQRADVPFDDWQKRASTLLTEASVCAELKGGQVYPVTFSSIARNEFHHEGQGQTRYDVFLVPDEETQALMRRIHTELQLPPRDLDWHVTASIAWSRAEADRNAEEWTARLPLRARFASVVTDY